MKKNESIRKTIKQTYIVIIALLLIPPVFCISLFLWQTIQYDRIITNVNNIKNLNQIVKNDISNEIWDIVAGNIAFEQGKQFLIINKINTVLDEIEKSTKSTKNIRLLQVAGRAVDTLTKYVKQLGIDMKSGSKVAKNEQTLEDIRGVTVLISDILQDFIVTEIEYAAEMNKAMKKNSILFFISQIMIVLFVIFFAIKSKRNVSGKIENPIQKLESLSTLIAEGNLDARADLPNVAELNNLTKNLNTMAERLKKQIEENLEEQKNLQKAEMKTLQAQITPHFLYNTLDTIIWLAEAKQYEEVINITRALSNFFRITLSRGQEWITVKEEIDHINSYLTIQKIRYRDILNFSIDYDETMAELPFLKLILQPLVENALYHGIKNKRGKGMITINGYRTEIDNKKYIGFTIQDNGIGITEERLDEIKQQLKTYPNNNTTIVYGLYNVYRRLYLYYNSAISFEIKSEYQIGTEVTLLVPERISNV